MRFRRSFFLAIALVSGVIMHAALRTLDAPAALPDDPAPAAKTSVYEKEILPFLKKHCFSCHGNGKAKADLSFDKFKDDKSVLFDRKTWNGVQHMLENREMPPEGRPKPEYAEIESTVKAIRGLFHEFDRTAKVNVGRVTIRRLNRTEYNNTIRDLVGVDFKPAEDFPADDVGYGFDNIGDVLSVSPLLLEKYLTAAENILEQVIVIVDPPKPAKQKVNIVAGKFKNNNPNDMGGQVTFDDGDYFIRCQVTADQAGEEPVKAKLSAGGKALKEFEIKDTDKSVSHEVKLRMKQGTSRVSVALLNPTMNPPEKGPKRALYIKSLEIEGPFDPPPPPRSEAYKRLMNHKEGLTPREAARDRHAVRDPAFRRPVESDEIAACMELYDNSVKKGRRFETSVQIALYRVLVSPHFLFRVELDPPNTPPGTPYMIGEFELASRLSYFLWNSMPDDELLALAGKGELRKNLPGQLARMTKDPKSQSFLESFAEQWLLLRKLDLVSPDAKLFPTFNAGLKEAMIRESQLFFAAVVRENRSILDLLDADFTYVNAPLAKHYGITGFKGKGFVRVKAPQGRGGVLTQASVLALTSNATRTSPVQRGKFVLEQILNTPPPPPPEDVPELDDQKELKGTLRQIMEQHRVNAVCASCHRRMDPLGFAFENFDAIGAWREKDGEAKVDASGELPSGQAFNGADGLKKILRQNNSLFTRCLSEKMLTYALGRGLEPYDRRAVDKIAEAVANDEYRFATLIAEIVKSDPFQMRMTGEAK